MGLVAFKVATNQPAEFTSLISVVIRSVITPSIASLHKLCPDFVLCNVVNLARHLGT